MVYLTVICLEGVEKFHCEGLQHPPRKSRADVLVLELLIGRIALLKSLQEIYRLFSVRYVYKTMAFVRLNVCIRQALQFDRRFPHFLDDEFHAEFLPLHKIKCYQPGDPEPKQFETSLLPRSRYRSLCAAEGWFRKAGASRNSARTPVKINPAIVSKNMCSTSVVLAFRTEAPRPSLAGPSRERLSSCLIAIDM
jgi:hypothetical protein